MAQAERGAMMAKELAALKAGLPEYYRRVTGHQLRAQGSRLVGTCPKHDDQNPSFAIFGSEHAMCGCFSCGFTGDVFDLSQLLGRSATFSDALQDVTDVLGANLAEFATAPKSSPRKTSPLLSIVLSDQDRKKIHAARLAFTDSLHAGELNEMAAELGLPIEAFTWCAFGPSGFGLYDGRLCYRYPHGLKVRNPQGVKPRFRWECGKATAPWRAEWIKPATRTVYVTEGESDCIALVAAGLENDPTVACVASPGISFRESWATLFTGKRVVLVFDADEAGLNATDRVAGILKGHAAQIFTWKGPKP